MSQNNTYTYHQDIHKYLPNFSLLESLHVHKGYSRKLLPAGNQGYSQGFHYDTLIIDDRRGFYRLRHCVTTLYHRNQAVGFCDMTTPFLYPDYKFSCFGRNSEIIQSRLHRYADDHMGVPQRDLRLGEPNYGKEGFFVETAYSQLPVVQAMPVLNRKILDIYHLKDKEFKKNGHVHKS